MTSGSFKSARISDIVFDDAERQRSELPDIEPLAASIARRGLIHPILLTSDLHLVAGRCRLEACKSLGWTHITYQEEGSEDPAVLQELELEENIRRIDLPWQDKVSAVDRYHALRIAEDPKWTQEDTAAALGWKRTAITEHIAVAKEIKAGNAMIKAAPEFSTARGIVRRKEDRARVAETLSLTKTTSGENQSIFNEDFLKWVETYDGPAFNFLHCDFPYGIDAGGFHQGAAKSFGGYEDTIEKYWTLTESLISNRDKLLGNSGHVVFWFSMEYYTDTLIALSKAFTVNKFPLVWHKDKGTLPDPERGPRRVGEYAFLCTHGDRKIVRACDNIIQAPLGAREHMSEKAQPMLEYFFKMLVDDSTVMLDPTCGSGSSLRAAEALGAKSTLGLEINKDYAENAQQVLTKWRLDNAPKKDTSGSRSPDIIRPE